MKCPNCNSEIKEGFLLCSVCGKELSYVPTYDAAVEVEMDKVMSNVNVELQDTVDLSGHPELALTKDLSKTTDINDLYEKLGNKKSGGFKKYKKLLVYIIVICVLIAVGLIAANVYYKNNTCDALVQRARAFIEKGDYDNAIPLYQSAAKKTEASDEIVYELANAYYLIGDTDNSINELVSLIAKNPSYRDAYALLITIYESKDMFENICYLLNECPDISIYDEFRQYVAPIPGFSSDEGTYDGPLLLSLLVDVPGKIYFTLDGSEPDENSIEYKEPISLDSGKCVVRALFINEYGIKSESVSKIYNIVSKAPQIPVVTPEEGDYDKPTYIMAELEDRKTIYYTSDGTNPDENSEEYIYPIPMRIGENIYKFVSIDEEGNKSDVSVLKYNLNVESSFSEADAVNLLVQNLTITGKLADVSGVAASLNGMYLYKCNTIINSNNVNAYLIEEYYKGIENDSYIPTDTYYGVGIDDATIYSAVRGAGNLFELK